MGKIFEALNKASGSQLKKPHSREREKPFSASPPKPREKTLSPQPTSLEQISVKPNNARKHIAPDSQWEERIRLAVSPSSTIGESFKKLRTKILHPDQGTPPRTILITSAVPAEGKGFVTANLGISIAKNAENKCTMIDCDLRRPTLANVFAIELDRKGLTNYLRNDLDSWEEAIQPTAQENLYLLPSGRPPENPTELIDSNKMFNFMKELSNKMGEIFLLDSPPIHAAAETAVLAKMVEKVLIVVRWGTSGRDQVKNLIETVGREKIIGVVFNAFEQNALDSVFEKRGYYGYYGYYGKNY